MDLDIDYAETESVGNQVIEKGEEFQELLDKIKGINTDLQTYWEGSDSVKYSTSVAQQAEYMQELINTINDLGAFLVKISSAYRDVKESNSNAIQG